MLLLDARHEGYEDKSISTAEVTKYCSCIRDDKVFIDKFNSYEYPKYQENMGTGNVRRQKVQGRLLTIAEDFEEHFGISDTDILGESVESVGNVMG